MADHLTAEDVDIDELLEMDDEELEKLMGPQRERILAASSETPSTKCLLQGRFAKTKIEAVQYVSTRQFNEKLIHQMHFHMDEMSEAELRKIAWETVLYAGGTRRQLKERLKKVFRKEWAILRASVDQTISSHHKTAYYYDYLIFIDFECTCEEILNQYPHEIIEFPAVLVDVKEQRVISEFHTYVRPVARPKLDPFCIEFTSIQQHQVDNAPYFPEALLLFQEWMNSFNLDLNTKKNYAFVTDGPCDFQKFLLFQCLILGMKLPHMFRHFINIKRIFELKEQRLEGKGQRDEQGKRITSIQRMLDYYDIKSVGRAHSGLVDAHNLANIAFHMMRKGIDLKVNQRIVRKTNDSDVHFERIIQKAKEADDPVKAQETLDRALWDKRLPYKHVYLRANEFYSESYLDCSSCDEENESEEEESFEEQPPTPPSTSEKKITEFTLSTTDFWDPAWPRMKNHYLEAKKLHRDSYNRKYRYLKRQY